MVGSWRRAMYREGRSTLGVGRVELLLGVACVVVHSSGCGSVGSFSD